MSCRDLQGSHINPARQLSLGSMRSFEQVEDELFDLPPGEDLVQPRQRVAYTERAEEPAEDEEDRNSLDCLLQETVSGGLLGKR